MTHAHGMIHRLVSRARLGRRSMPATRAGADVLLAAIITVAGLLTLGDRPAAHPAESAAILVAGVALALRRRAPGPALLVVLACTMLVTLTLGGAVPWALLVAVATAAAELPPRRSAVGCALACAAPLPIAFVGQADSLLAAGFYEALIVGAWVAGAAWRSRRMLLAELEDKAARLEAGRAAVAARAAAEEQARVAREVHDVVAHSLGAIVVQAAAAARAADEHADAAERALRSIEEAGRHALRELRQTLEPARGGTPAAEEDAALPERIGDLERRLRPTGLVTSVNGIDALAPLRGAQAAATYRFVQEALTNVVRHAGAGRATVRARADGDAVHVAVSDDGSGPPPEGFGAGRGLRGMHERAVALGGTIEIARAPEGGTVVRLTLPPAASRA